VHGVAETVSDYHAYKYTHQAWHAHGAIDPEPQYKAFKTNHWQLPSDITYKGSSFNLKFNEKK
jgi:hypothetical protein